MAGVQGGCVVLLYTLIHTQVARFRVTNLESKSFLEIKLNSNWQKSEYFHTRPKY